MWASRWQAWGLQPDLLMGHSIGEVVAAHVAGVLSLDDAAALVCARGRLMDTLAVAGGRMASLEADADEVAMALEALSPAQRAQVSIAAENHPTQTVVSGDAEAVEAVVELFVEEDRRTRFLTVSHAFHSPHMEPMLADFAAVLEGLHFRPPRIAVVSNVTGALADPEAGDLVTSAYWVRHVRHAVRFVTGVEAACAAGATAPLALIGPSWAARARNG